MSATDPTQVVLFAKVLTVSDGVFHGARDDTGGRGLAAHLASNGFWRRKLHSSPERATNRLTKPDSTRAFSKIV